MIINEDYLNEKITKLFNKNGLSLENSKIVSQCLILTEKSGIYTHGLNMIPAHIKKCKKGYNINASLDILKQSPSFSVCNANNSMGIISAWECMNLAIKKSEILGMHTVFCGNANTFSAAYCYCKQAINQGKIAIILSNAPSQMAPFGGKEKLIGTNPVAIGIPSNKEKPFILDMATSIIAKSKINEFVSNGISTIPLGWATDIHGNPTTDSKEAQKGLVLPMAGPKGYGLALAIDILTGFISKSGYLNNVNRFYGQDDGMKVGHTFIVIDPLKIYGDDFYTDMDDYLRTIRESTPIDEYKQVLIPGDINQQNIDLCNQQGGIAVNDALILEINKLLNDVGVEKIKWIQKEKNI